MEKPTKMIAQCTEGYDLDPVYISSTDLLTYKILGAVLIYPPLFLILIVLFYTSN